jgi:hypothetical protein
MVDKTVKLVTAVRKQAFLLLVAMQHNSKGVTSVSMEVVN